MTPPITEFPQKCVVGVRAVYGNHVIAVQGTVRLEASLRESDVDGLGDHVLERD